MYWNNILSVRLIMAMKGLTLTWDVLKCKCELKVSNFTCRLTLTWDVLKSWNIIY